VRPLTRPQATPPLMRPRLQLVTASPDFVAHAGPSPSEPD